MKHSGGFNILLQNENVQINMFVERLLSHYKLPVPLKFCMAQMDSVS